MKITLKVEKDNTIESIQHEITKLKIHQITKSLVVIKDVFEIVQKDEALKEAFAEMMNDNFNSENEESENEESENKESEDEINERGGEFMYKLVGAYETLLLNLPGKAIELLSLLSGIEKDVVMAQDAEDVFDIYDAVLEENDIEKLINRAKKSLAVTKKRIQFKKIATQATATTTQQ